MFDRLSRKAVRVIMYKGTNRVETIREQTGIKGYGPGFGGIDKVILQVELFQFPAPDFIVTSSHTKSILYAQKSFADMEKSDRIRACYQHACLKYVSNEFLTNTTLRDRFSIAKKNYSMASRIIADTVDNKMIKRYDPENLSKKHTKYIPFWA